MAKNEKEKENENYELDETFESSIEIQHCL